MELYRKKKVIECTNKINSLKNFIKRTETSLKNFNKLSKDDRVSEKILKIQSELQNAHNDVEYNEIQIKSYLSGELDSEIEKELVIIPTKKLKKDISNNKNQTLNTDDRYNKEKDAEYQYKRYYKTLESLPDYMKKNLSEMNSNKGYIWRDCWFFGQKCVNNRYPLIMFEKLRNSVLRIHEINELEYKIFEKSGDEKRKLISHFYKR